MTLPSTEELQRLLDAATPGEWEPRSDPDWGFIDIHGVQSQDGEPVCIDGTPQDCIVLALAPALAAEVIRLRKENQRMQERVNKHAQDALRLTKFLHDHHPVVHAEFKSNLARILEGDQA